jgi:phospholipid-binding lipoprotein MlaA
MRASSCLRPGLALSLGLAVSACAHTPADDPSDPLEPVNRAMFTFNRQADRYLLRPVAKGYVKVVPDLARRGIGNFFNNLFYPTVIVNDLLQAKFLQSSQDLARFLLNSTAGFAGILDVATGVGLPQNNEDFGQTLGYWGLGPGWYLMIPFLGPSNNRDLVGRGGDYFTSPLLYIDEEKVRYIATGVNLIDTRANLLGADRFIDEQFDPYIAVRTAYLMRRQNLVYDGNPPKIDYDFEE